jgi:hypothetical protein
MDSSYEPLEDDYDREWCAVCGSDMAWEQCWQCHGEGGFHDCGEDCCPCLEPDLNETCEECGGRGGYLVCLSLPHTEEELAEYSRRQDKADAKKAGG